MTHPIPPDVKAAFDEIPQPQRDRLLAIRDLIFDCADTASDVGKVAEVLRWGQPSYIAPKGSTLRLGVAKTGDPALYAHCQTNIISTFADRFPQDFQIEGNRGVYLKSLTPSDQEKLRLLILHGLRYKIG